MLNNLISKDYKTAQIAAREFVDSGDAELFALLEEKSEFLFGFVKEKILKNLMSALSLKNVTNLFEFAKVYSTDFRGFILNGLLRFQNADIINKIIELLSSGTSSQKAYILEFLTAEKSKTDNEEIRLKAIGAARECFKSDFEPLKTASVRFLAYANERSEYKDALEKLKGNADELEKLGAVEFLAAYGDKDAFEEAYKYFISSGMQAIAASNLLLLKGFDEIEDEQALFILSAILRAYPDEITFEELYCYLENGVFDLLAETPNEFAPLLIFYLQKKISLVLNNDAYAIDLSKNEKDAAEEILAKAKTICQMYSRPDTLKSAMESGEPLQNLVALEIAESTDDFPFNKISALCTNSKNDEVILFCIKTLYRCRKLTAEIVKMAADKVQNEIIRQEILNLL